MPEFKTLADRQADQAKAREILAERLRKMATRPVRSKQPPAAPKVVAPAPPAPALTPAAQRPWARVRAGSATLDYNARSASERIAPQPWTNDLVSTLLEAAELGGVTLCLVWPAKLNSLSLLHALANVERLFAKDLRGLRTLLYPGTHTSRAPLHGVLAEKTQLSDFYRTLWVAQPNGSTKVISNTASPAVLAALGAVNDIRIRNPELSNPSLAELVPTFVFDPAKKMWATTVTNPLERTLSKVERLANRRDLRDKVGTEWGAADKAPGALMVLHHTAKRDVWRAALTGSALKGPGRPEVLLLDATAAAAQTNYSAVKRIPDFLLFARENGFGDTGVVVVTDDPKSFFVLRAQLYDLKLVPTWKVWAAEAYDILLSASPVSPDWKPAQRSNSNFSVSIVDRDASQLALAFQRLTTSAGSEESPAHQALLAACMYVLRLSNMPAGYSDLTAASTEAGGTDFGSQLNAWTPVKMAMQEALASGALNHVRAEVERAIVRADRLIDDWNDATPMASRVLAEVKKHTLNGRDGISLVLPNDKYVRLAHRFLRRQLANDWVAVETRLEWHTLSAVAKTLAGDRKGKHFAFVGVSPDVLRILLTHPDVPHGTAVLVAYRQAESTLKTLTSMKEVDAFKAYRGRIGLLAQELQRRLDEVPNPIVIGKLREMSLTFKFDDNVQNGGGDQAYYKFELEGEGRAYASGWVYRYLPDDDPPFGRVPASTIQPGYFIFDMSDELRANLESALHLNGDGVSSVVDPVRMLLKLYHADVQTRCSLMFTSTKRSTLAREIRAKMVAIDPKTAECSTARVYYWLALQSEGDTRPHASKDFKFFKFFCKALEISDENSDGYWALIRNARSLNQSQGRELVARYAEILFRPESAAIYRKVPEEVIKHLQQEALRCVYRVERVVPPLARVEPATQKKESSKCPS
jgi:hypothetical protein